MTPRQSRFVEEYLVDCNATQAYIRAGYAPKHADVAGPALLGNIGVATAIAARRKVLADKIEVTQERIVAEYAKLAFTDTSDVVAWGSREVQMGFDADGKRLPADQIGEAVMVRTELAPYVDAIESSDLSAAARGAVAEVALTKNGLRIKMHDKRAALKDLGQHLGMFVEQHRHTLTLEMLIREYLPEDDRVIEGEAREVERDG